MTFTKNSTVQVDLTLAQEKPEWLVQAESAKNEKSSDNSLDSENATGEVQGKSVSSN